MTEMPAWRRRRFMKMRARARKLGLVIGSLEWRKFLGLKDKVVEAVKHSTADSIFRKLELRQKVSVGMQVPKTLAKPIAEPVVHIPKTTKEDRRPRPGKTR
jgi:hypothetical protein